MVRLGVRFGAIVLALVLLWLSNAALLALLAFLLLIEGVAFFSLLWWPIPIAAALLSLEGYLQIRLRGWLLVHILGAALLYAVRVLLDLWPPIGQ